MREGTREAKMEKLKKQRIRLSKAEIDKAREELLEQGKEKATAKQKPTSTEPKYAKDFWHDGVYCDSYGCCWGLDENLSTICLGKTEQVVKREISFPGDNETHSCHSKLKNDRPSISGGGAKSIVATFRKDPRFLRLLDDLISNGFGIRAIHSELKTKGYQIPLRTVGRWIKQREEVNDAQSNLD